MTFLKRQAKHPHHYSLFTIHFSLFTHLSYLLTHRKISTKYFLSKALDNHTFRGENISSIEKQPFFGYFAVKLASNLMGSFRPAIITAFNPVILIK